MDDFGILLLQPKRIFRGMKAEKRDIVEFFGYAPSDQSAEALNAWGNKVCPFRKQTCSKFNHDKSEVYGVCSVTNGVKQDVGSEVIICPKRLYAESFKSLLDVAKLAWPNEEFEFVVDAPDINRLLEIASQYDSVVVAFGQGSGNEVSVSSPNGRLSMDWVLQKYNKDFAGNLLPVNFVGVEVQSIDITGNYRDTWAAYERMKMKLEVDHIPNSGHGLNWANVHKRLIPQIIRKGNVYSEANKCMGFFFVLPDAVYIKFEEILGIAGGKQLLIEQLGASKDNLTIVTYNLGPLVSEGKQRMLEKCRVINYRLVDVIEAFSSNQYSESALELDEKLLSYKYEV